MSRLLTILHWCMHIRVDELCHDLASVCATSIYLQLRPGKNVGSLSFLPDILVSLGLLHVVFVFNSITT